MDTNGEYRSVRPAPIMIQHLLPDVISASSGVSPDGENMLLAGEAGPASPAPRRPINNLSPAVACDAAGAMEESPAKYLRPWGFYQSLIIGPRYQVKRIVVEPGGRLSLQKHFHRSEHWVVVEGTALVTCDDNTTLLHETESVFLPAGSLHRLENPGRIAITIIEVQSGPYLGEDDILRLEDSYGRS